MVVVPVGQVGVGERVDRRAVVRDPAVAHHHRPVDQRTERAELVGDQHDRGAAGDAGSAARRRRPAGSPGRRPAVGSSRTSRSGTPASARAMSTRCCWPPDSVATPSRALSASPTAAIGPRDRLLVRAAHRQERPAPRQPAGGDHLLHRGGYAGRGAGPLRDEADPAASRGTRSRGVPNSRTSPRTTGTSPIIERTSVDLPEPLAPSTASTSPWRTARSMPRRIGRPPSSTAPSRTCTTAVVSGRS